MMQKHTKRRKYSTFHVLVMDLSRMNSFLPKNERLVTMRSNISGTSELEPAGHSNSNLVSLSH